MFRSPCRLVLQVQRYPLGEWLVLSRKRLWIRSARTGILARSGAFPTTALVLTALHRNLAHARSFLQKSGASSELGPHFQCGQLEFLSFNYLLTPTDRRHDEVAFWFWLRVPETFANPRAKGQSGNAKFNRPG